MRNLSGRIAERQTRVNDVRDAKAQRIAGERAKPVLGSITRHGARLMLQICRDPLYKLYSVHVCSNGVHYPFFRILCPHFRWNHVYHGVGL